MQFSEIISRLGLGTGNQVIYSIFLYLIFFFALIAFFTQKEPNNSVLFFLAGTLLIALVDKVAVPGLLRPRELAVLLGRGMLFVLPILAAGVTRAPRTRNLSIITAFIGFVYFMIRGLIDWQFFNISAR
jgi:hypothetical protein